MQSAVRKNSKFKKVCLHAIHAFEAIDSLKILLSEYKALSRSSSKNEFVKLSEKQIEDTKQLLSAFKSNFKYINKKKSIRLIRRKIGKKKRTFRINKDEAYNKALIHFAISHMVFQGEKLNNSNNLKSQVEAREIPKKNNDYDKLNNTIYELKELNDYGNTLAKIIEIRSRNKVGCQADTHFSSIKKLNDLIELVENRKRKYQAEKTTIRELSKSLDASTNDKRARASYSEKDLSILETEVNKNLFGPSTNSNLDELNCFELFFKQSDISINNLIIIRREWDDFLSCSSNAQSIPIQWVPLDEPNDLEWSNFIKTKT